jgi:hypothetical protein
MMATITERDREIARLLPDLFLDLPGTARLRVRGLVHKYWGFYDARAVANLVQVLLPFLKPLLQPGAEVTDEQRGICEALVTGWVARQ